MICAKEHEATASRKPTSPRTNVIQKDARSPGSSRGEHTSSNLRQTRTHYTRMQRRTPRQREKRTRTTYKDITTKLQDYSCRDRLYTREARTPLRFDSRARQDTTIYREGVVPNYKCENREITTGGRQIQTPATGRQIQNPRPCHPPRPPPPPSAIRPDERTRRARKARRMHHASMHQCIVHHASTGEFPAPCMNRGDYYFLDNCFLQYTVILTVD